METVYLIGFMGAGKTSVGKVLGELWNMPVIDTDEKIEEEEKREIREIFAEEGEGYFREKEIEMLKRLEGEPCIVTTGGGIILKSENRELLKKSGRAVFLRCHPEVVAERLAEDETRPLLKGAGLEDIIRLYETRLPLYTECADYEIDTSILSIGEAAERIAESMEEGRSRNTER